MRLTSSPIRRSALTLAEVLISMGILVVGLLGVASLFPVGGHYMQQGDIADRAGAIAQAALDDAIVRGHLNPENWVVHDVYSNLSANAFMKLVSGEIITGSGSSSFGTGLRQSIAMNGGTVLGVNKGAVDFRSTIHGGAFVIDPFGLAAALADPSADNSLVVRPDLSTTVRHFPGVALPVVYNHSAWEPWNAAGAFWPVRRVTPVHSMQGLNGATSFKRQEPLAAKYFRTSDDLALVMPENGDDPTRGRWETWANGAAPQAAVRQSRGNYSWIISVSPGSSEARDALATQPDAFQYDVSAVVFYKRALGHGYAEALEAERLVQAKVVSTGTAGGELLLERFYSSGATNKPVGLPSGAADEPDTTPFEDLRAGEYVMLTGPHPLSTQDRPMLFLQWYRVLTIEDSGSPNLRGTTLPLNRENRVLVSLRGPDWPWQPGTNLSDNILSNDLRVTIIPGAVAVHSKTMRLEAGSAWSGE